MRITKLVLSLFVFISFIQINAFSAEQLVPAPYGNFVPIGVDFDAKESCIDVACAVRGNCNDETELKDITTACNNVDGLCVRQVCKGDHCRWKETLIEGINSCKLSNSSCVVTGCTTYNHCTFRQDAFNIAKSCFNVTDDNCAENICKRTRKCRFKDEFIEVAQRCGGKEN